VPGRELFADAFVPRSAAPGVTFPALLDARSAMIVSLLAQLAQSQWWSPEQLRDAQLRQLGPLLAHAARTTAWGRAQFPDLATQPLTWARFHTLPTVSRRLLQSRRAEFVSDAVPKEHGDMAPARTSGSTGTPVVVDRTRVTDLLWTALTAREHLWFARDTRQPMAVIRHAPEAKGPDGLTLDSWGPPASVVGPPGPCHLLHVGATTGEQLAWLRRRRFSWLFLYPSGLADLLRLAEREGVHFPDLVGVRTFGEVVTPELRAQVHAQWGVPIHDLYSTQELGYLGLQCPDHDHFHVQSEAVVMEVLRDDGTPAEVGEVGRLVATSLHNFAMPLIRYDFGDLGVMGPACPCGRGLPVLSRVLGRVHQTFVTREGDRIWLTVGIHLLRDLAPVAQHQLVQRAVDHLELRAVPERPPTAAEDAALVAFLADKLPAGTRVTVAWVDQIPRAATGKFLDFVSEVAPPGA
jgi:phenylacetate-CoA ligase